MDLEQLEKDDVLNLINVVYTTHAVGVGRTSFMLCRVLLLLLRFLKHPQGAILREQALPAVLRAATAVAMRSLRHVDDLPHAMYVLQLTAVLFLRTCSQFAAAREWLRA